jgi:hypothetical protein
MSEKEKYLASIKAKKAAGLTNVKFYTANTFNKSEEEVYAELNRMDSSPDLEDQEVLGNRSIAA